jgi:hypothetical protein
MRENTKEPHDGQLTRRGFVWMSPRLFAASTNASKPINLLLSRGCGGPSTTADPFAPCACNFNIKTPTGKRQAFSH